MEEYEISIQIKQLHGQRFSAIGEKKSYEFLQKPILQVVRVSLLNILYKLFFGILFWFLES